MTDAAPVERRRLSVAGADAVVAAVERGVALADALADADVHWQSIRGELVTSERSIVVAEHAGGPVLAAKCFAPDESTTIHDHGVAGAALVVEGRARYERFARVDGDRVTSVEVKELGPGGISSWGEAPDDIHRQTALAGGAIELVLLAGVPKDPDEYALES